MSHGAATAKAIMKQLQDITQNPIDGITLKPTETLEEIEADIKGPEDTPFVGGTFGVMLIFGDGYPEAPPKGYFKTKIFHPNVSEKGEICVNALKRDWNPSIGLRHILTVIRCLLIEPNPESALNEEAGRLLLEDYQEYFKRAKMHTTIHAMNSSSASSASAGNTTSNSNSSSSNNTNNNTLRNVEDTNTSHKSSQAAEKKAVEKKRAALRRL